MLPLIPLISALTPLVPLITKMFNVKKGVESVAKTTGQTEVGQLAYVSAIMLVLADYQSCGSVSCVTDEHWGALVVSLFFVTSRFITKWVNDNG